MSNSIEIKVEADKLTPEAFLQASRSFFDLVLGVSKNVLGSAKETDWSVEVEPGSTIIRTRGAGPDQSRAIDVATNGLRLLQSGIRAIPDGFTRKEVTAVKELASIIDGTSVRAVSILNGLSPIAISVEAGRAADAILSVQKHEAFGSIEGRIETLQGRESYPVAFYVSEANYRRTVVCHFNRPELDEQAVLAFRKRVMVSGLIHYGIDGVPTSVDADSMRIFPDEQDLPTVEQVQAIFR